MKLYTDDYIILAAAILIFIVAGLLIIYSSSTYYDIDCTNLHLKHVKAFINQYGIIYTDDGQVLSTSQCIATTVQ